MHYKSINRIETHIEIILTKDFKHFSTLLECGDYKSFFFQYIYNFNLKKNYLNNVLEIKSYNLTSNTI